MAKKIFIIVIVTIINWSTTFYVHQPNRETIHVADSYHQEVGSALEATLMITMYGFQPDVRDEYGHITELGEPSVTEGLGTVIAFGERKMVVTHDHWSLLDADLELVQFRSAQQELVAQVSGQEFQALIQYRDGGTMIVEMPETLDGKTETVRWNRLPSLERGMTVQVVHRRRDGHGGVAMVAATVERIVWTEGVPSMRLRSHNGHVIVQGDSGGGIWADGQLAGIMWMTLAMNVISPEQSGIKAAVRTEENWSLAAVLTGNIQQELAQTTGPELGTMPESDSLPEAANSHGLPPVATNGHVS